MSTQLAMIRYLDNNDNRKSSPNQNFGRELLELFLLGVGNYTEADVEASTAAWTGHSVDWETAPHGTQPPGNSNIVPAGDQPRQDDDGQRPRLEVMTPYWTGPAMIDQHRQPAATRSPSRPSSSPASCGPSSPYADPGRR